jgi:hypothetical protein
MLTETPLDAAASESAWAPDLVAALVRTGHRTAARRVQRRFTERASAAGTAEMLALAERRAGLVADDEGDEHFTAARTAKLGVGSRTQLASLPVLDPSAVVEAADAR